jgi:hypothetical protein
MKRATINQPSTLQPLHELHGVQVLASEEIRPGTVLIYFLEGETVSQECPTQAISEGWTK